MMKMTKLTWKQLFDILDGSGLIITDYNLINDTLDVLDTKLENPIGEIEMWYVDEQ
jgi:hypothetical protein